MYKYHLYLIIHIDILYLHYTYIILIPQTIIKLSSNYHQTIIIIHTIINILIIISNILSYLYMIYAIMILCLF